MKAVIFLGPTLDLAAARRLLDATYLPPAAQADLLSALETYKPDVIGLIDGVFSQSLAVWHKEILYALQAGVRVYGASSMGALRAAETADFGMIGIGEIYRLYREGELTDDDEVALAHGEAESGYRGLSLPMINVRLTFRAAREAGIIDAECCATLTAIAKSIFFPERIWPQIFSKAAASGVAEQAITSMQDFVRGHYVDQKRQDALELLQTIRDLPADALQAPVAFSLHKPLAFQALYQLDRKVRHAGVDLPLATIARHAALHEQDFNDLNFHALNRALAVVLAEMLEVEITAAAIGDEARRFRIKYDLVAEESFSAWLGRNHLTPEQFAELMREIAQCRALHRWLMVRWQMVRNNKNLLDELRLRNRYEGCADAAAAEERLLQEFDPAGESRAPAAVPALLADHQRETGFRTEIPWQAWWEEAGFANVQHLQGTLARSQRARRAEGRLAEELAAMLDPEPLAD